MTALHVCMIECLMITGCESINGNDRTTFFFLPVDIKMDNSNTHELVARQRCDRKANEQQADMKAMGPKDTAWQFVLC